MQFLSSNVLSSNVLTVAVVLATFQLGSVAALGINCRGSGYCSSEPGDTMQQVVNGILATDPSRYYNGGEQIACANSVCAFVQNSGGAEASTLQTLAPNLLSHGCSVCGSVPLGYPFSNDVSQGELTVNYVSNPCSYAPQGTVC